MTAPASSGYPVLAAALELGLIAAFASATLNKAVFFWRGGAALRALPNPFGVASEAELSVLTYARLWVLGTVAFVGLDVALHRLRGESFWAKLAVHRAGGRARYSIERLARAASAGAFEGLLCALARTAPALACDAPHALAALAGLWLANACFGLAHALAHVDALWPRAHEYHHRHTPTSFSDGLAIDCVDLLFDGHAPAAVGGALAHAALLGASSPPWRFAYVIAILYLLPTLAIHSTAPKRLAARFPALAPLDAALGSRRHVGHHELSFAHPHALFWMPGCDALLSRIVSAFDPRRARFVRRRAYVASCARAGDEVKRRTCRM